MGAGEHEARLLGLDVEQVDWIRRGRVKSEGGWRFRAEGNSLISSTD